MLNIIDHEGNASQNNIEISLYKSEWLSSLPQTKQMLVRMWGKGNPY
jgi:hypothetical protein